MKILVIEDEGKVANLAKKGLEQAGYEVEVAADGEEGFDKFRAADFDLIVLDLMLPKITGWELIPIFRKRKPLLPIIAVTAKTAVEDRVQGRLRQNLQRELGDFVIRRADGQAEGVHSCCISPSRTRPA